MKYLFFIGSFLLFVATSPAYSGESSDSWLQQIEASLAQTARRLEVESVARQTRVNNSLQQLSSEQGSTERLSHSPARPAEFTLPPSVYVGGSLARQAQINRFEHTEQVQMQREALLKKNAGLHRHSIGGIELNLSSYQLPYRR